MAKKETNESEAPLTHIKGVGELNLKTVEQQIGKLHILNSKLYVFQGISEDCSDYCWKLATEQDIRQRDIGTDKDLQ